MPRLRLNKDKINMARPREVAASVMMTLNGLQDYTPEIQVMGAAAVFLELSEALGIPPQEVFTATKNLIAGQDGKRPEFTAIQDYIQGEMI
jgi:hypothetical protein